MPKTISQTTYHPTYKFGTDGIRATANEFTPELLNSIAVGLSNVATQKSANPKIFLAGDTRESTEWILQDLSTALESLGIEYSTAGILPTPAINYCFYEMGFDYAIDVTASHNPYTDNGIKIFERSTNSGTKLGPASQKIIESAINSPQTLTPVSTTDRASLHQEALSIYKEHLINYLKIADFSKLRIGIDCANGATSVIGKHIFEELGAFTELINSNPHYNQNINDHCGSTHLAPLQKLVKSQKLDFGVAFDGDGDRVLMIDAKGNIIDGDQIIAIIANYLNLDKIAVTVMANQGLLNWAKENHIHAEITPVGDSNVASAMQEHHIQLGGEQSGHIILPNETTGDGMLTALFIAKIISETGKPLHDLANIITKLPQVIVNFNATPAQKSKLEASDAVKNILAHFTEKVKPLDGRILDRPSGTEPLIRITVWGNDEDKITHLAEELKTKLGEIL